MKWRSSVLTSAGLLVRSLMHLQRIDPGFTASRVLTGTINLPQSEYTTQERWLAFNSQLLDRVRQMPGVVDAAFGVGVPFLSPPVKVPFEIEGRPEGQAGATHAGEFVISSPGYFRVLQIPLIRGRAFADTDTRRTMRVGIVNRAFAQRYFGDENPVGRAILLGAAKGMRIEIVGLVGDTAHTSLVTPPPPLLHLPYAQRPFWITSFFLRTVGEPHDVAAALRREVTAMAPAIPVLALESMDAILQQSIAASRHRTLLLGLLSALALMLAAVGMYGLLAFTVPGHQRDRDSPGLGAAPRRVRRLVIGQALRLTLAGWRLVSGSRGRHTISREPAVSRQRHRSVDTAAAACSSCSSRSSPPRARAQGDDVDPLIALRAE